MRGMPRLAFPGPAVDRTATRAVARAVYDPALRGPAPSPRAP